MQHDAQDLLEQFVGPSGTHRDNSLDLHHRERADVVFTCVDGRSVLAHAPVLRAGSLVLDDRLRGAVPTECGADDILRVPIEVAVESASLHPVLCWMYGHGVSLPKVRRLLLGASDHVVLRGACALAQKWGLKGFVQALEDAAFGVGGVQACEALGTTRPLLRAAVENWLPSGDTVRALGLSRRCREWAGPGASSCR